MLEQRTGKTLSSESAEACKLYQQGVDMILGSESGAARALDRALELDNDFALAAAARYCVAKDVGDENAQVYRQRAEQSLSKSSDWEREHVEMLIGLIDQPGVTREKALAYINTSPADLLVVSQLAGYMFFYDGPDKLQSVLNLLESVEHALGDDWAFLARLGFAASEAGQRTRARTLLERALTIRPRSLYSIHGLAHMLHDDGAAEESTEVLNQWLKVHESSAREGQLYGHVQWHLALAEFQVGEREAAWQRYLTFCAPKTTTCGPILTLADCAGFLLRDYLQSGQTRELAEDEEKQIARVWGMMGHPFIALHVAGLYATAGDMEGLKRCEDVIAEKASGANRDVSLALVSSLSDFVAGNYQRSVQTLATVSPSARIGIGGSNVERILVDLIETSGESRI